MKVDEAIEIPGLPKKKKIKKKKNNNNNNNNNKCYLTSVISST